ncbi:pectate lyase/Amb allergen [Cladochytrium replicatum]|nr:pectate lyase/Amb allergen [Cladochytrium replicatum]
MRLSLRTLLAFLAASTVDARPLNSQNRASLLNDLSLLRPAGWGSGTFGGHGNFSNAAVYVVRNRVEFNASLANNGRPSSPKIIFVEGDVVGDQSDDLNPLAFEDYSPGYKFTDYLSCFEDNGLKDLTTGPYQTPGCKKINDQRLAAAAVQKSRVAFDIPSYTTIIGVGETGRFLGAMLRVDKKTQVVLYNLYIEAPRDLFTEWTPTDGAEGNWNAEYDAVQVTESTYIWVDHCTFTDGRFPKSQAPTAFGARRVEYHDGHLDITKSSDFVSVSNNLFASHDKTNLIGGSDTRTADSGTLRVTFYNNHWKSCNQRLPRVRFGRVHVFNNLFQAYTDDPDYPAKAGSSYFLGMGLEGKIFSESNVFEFVGAGNSSDIIVSALNGYEFFDRNSFYNGQPVNVAAIAYDKFLKRKMDRLESDAKAGTVSPEWALKNFTTNSWDPAQAYQYDILSLVDVIKANVLSNSGVGAR